MDMFCYQCQETAKGTGCTIRGVCGKDAPTANMMDALMFVIRGISTVCDTLEAHGQKIPPEVPEFIIDGLFSTITNANFDIALIRRRVQEGFKLRQRVVDQALAAGIAPGRYDEVTWTDQQVMAADRPDVVGILRPEDEDRRSLQQLAVYGIKGMAAYMEHAMRLGMDYPEIHRFIRSIFAKITRNDPADDWVKLVLDTGAAGVKAMALLDKANTTAYGQPEISKVNIGVGSRPGILVSGHDLRDMERLLIQSEGQGVDIYTHSEMLPANYYPRLKRYPHFVGNYGDAWWQQREQFESFNGAILFTTNCIVPPLKNASYTSRMFCTGATGYPGCQYIPVGPDGEKDFMPVIEAAKKCQPPREIERGSIVGGFAHDQVAKLAPQVVEAVKSGAIKRFIVMAGCDGRMKSRQYYTDFAKALPHDTVILTAGCAKYRYNKLELGDINGIPRVLDAGQCNDSYSLVVIAQMLQKAFGLDDINKLPIVYNIAWYEQKAIIVLLALLSLGVKDIHTGPTLPAFLSPSVAQTLVREFGLATPGTVDDDMRLFGIE